MGYFGHAGARPSRHFAPVDVDLGTSGLPPKIAICGQCDAHAVLIGDQLPDDWVLVKDLTVSGGQDARCPACKTLKRAPAQRVTVSTSLPTADDHPPIGRMYAGCRVTAWIVGGGNAIMRIHGGERARPGERDDPVHFLATPEDLDQLIIHFSTIRAQLQPKGKADV